MAQTDSRSATVTSAYAIVTCLFFAWGFITSLVDPLVAAVKGIFQLSDVEAQLSASAFFFAYFVVSIPGAFLVSRLRAVNSVLFSLGLMIGGCLLMLLAANIAVYPLVLLGLFVLASGITILQVAANPLAAGLGSPDKSHFRLTFSQTFNSLGTFIGPLIGAHLFLKGVEVKEGAVVTEAVRSQALAGIDSAYFWICGLLLALFLFFLVSRRVVSQAADSVRSDGTGSIAAAFSSPWALFGGLAIFLYVGAEVAIGSQMALFLNADSVWGQTQSPFGIPLLGWAMGSDGVAGVSLQEAGKAVAFYWGGAMVGRALGSALLTRIKAPVLLTVFTAAACAMCLYVYSVGGVSAGYVALAIGLFNSIMFPVIFTITLERSTASEEATSGLLCLSIVGGAVIPPLVGLVSQNSSYVAAFIVPAICYAILCFFAISAGRARIAHPTGVQEEPISAV